MSVELTYHKGLDGWSEEDVREDVEEHLIEQYLERGRIKKMSLRKGGADIKFIDDGAAIKFIRELRRRYDPKEVEMTYRSTGTSF